MLDFKSNGVSLRAQVRILPAANHNTFNCINKSECLLVMISLVLIHGIVVLFQRDSRGRLVNIPYGSVGSSPADCESFTQFIKVLK